MSARTVWTYQDYAALPDDGKRYEIHDGELCELTSPTSLHQIVLLNLATALRAHVSAGGLGRVMIAPLDVILSETTVLQPDVIYFDHERLSALRPHGVVGAATLVVEILSPSTARIDRTTKRRLYSRYGVSYFWFIDVDARVIEAQALRGGDCAVVATAAGTHPVDLPPFVGLDLVPSTLWD
jgi:Uma2 family endonuclease